MTTEEIGKLFNLLERLHSDKRAKRDKGTLTAWARTLGQWSYDQVCSAAIQRAQTGNRFFPDAPEIVAFCPPVPAKVAPDDWQTKALERHKELIELRRAAGIPNTWEEARRAALKAGKWLELLDEANLSVEVIL